MTRTFTDEVWKNKWFYIIAVILLFIVTVNGGLDGGYWSIESLMGYVLGFFFYIIYCYDNKVFYCKK